MLKELDVVRLKKNLPEHNLVAGIEGTIHQVYADDPPAYLIEFSDDEGLTLALLTLSEDALEIVWSTPPATIRPTQAVH